MSILKQFNKTHWSKPFFEKEEIPLKFVSQFIGRNYFYTSRILNAAVSPTPIIEERLHELVKLIAQGGDQDE
jgi:hypothetical protein